MENNSIKKRSGKVSLLYEDEWSEVIKTGRGKEKNVVLDHVIPEHGVFSIRFPKEDINKRIRIFIEETDETEDKTEPKDEEEAAK